MMLEIVEVFFFKLIIFFIISHSILQNIMMAHVTIEAEKQLLHAYTGMWETFS